MKDDFVKAGELRQKATKFVSRLDRMADEGVPKRPETERLPTYIKTTDGM
jgi:hypothetical protein